MQGRFLLVVACALGLLGAVSGLAATQAPEFFFQKTSQTLPDAPGYPSVEWSSLPLWTVTGVRDADTLTLESLEAGVSVEVDLAGVKAPGQRQPFGSEATFFTKALLEGEQVRVEWAKGDHLPEGSRRQAVLYRDPDGLCINLELVRAGLAQVRTPAKLPEHSPLPGDQATDSADSDAPATTDGSEADPIDPMPAVLEIYAQRAVLLQRNALGGGTPLCAHSEGSNADSAQPTAAIPAETSSDPADQSGEGDDQDTPSADQPMGDARQLVYLTPSGSKYHTKGCRFVSANSRSMPLAEAKGQYQPCRVCKPAE